MLLILLGCVPELYTPADVLEPESLEPDSFCDWQTPENSWTTAEPPCIEGEGFEVGDIAPDIRLIDQYGDEVSLWQFYGDLIFLDFSAEWCSPCKDLAEGLPEVMEEFEGEGVSAVTVIYNGAGPGAPTAEGLLQWSDYSEHVAPVLGDDGTWTDQVIVPNGSDGYPALFLIDRDMKVLVSEISPVSDQAVIEAIRDHL